jgi:flagellar M-ring protein FliF
VPQLDPKQISIVDDRGNLLARGMGAGSDDLANATAEEKTRGYEQRLARTVEDLLSRTVGFGKVRAEVSAQLDFDRVTTNSETYDPDSQVVRSTQTVNEQNQANDRNDSVTVANNLTPGDNTDTAGSGTGSKSSRNEETINYEISRTVRNHVRETGQVRRLSIAVLVDGVYEPAASGPPVYKPQPLEELKQIESLMRSAIGFDGAR